VTDTLPVNRQGRHGLPARPCAAGSTLDPLVSATALRFQCDTFKEATKLAKVTGRAFSLAQPKS
jgi:hypothetical protein